MMKNFDSIYLFIYLLTLIATVQFVTHNEIAQEFPGVTNTYTQKHTRTCTHAQITIELRIVKTFKYVEN